MNDDRNAANYFVTMAFLTGRPDEVFYDLCGYEEEKLPLAIRAFLTEWRRHTGRARPDWCPEVPQDCDLADLFNILDYCIDQILRTIVPKYERMGRPRRQRRGPDKRRKPKRAVVARGRTKRQSKEKPR